MPPHKALFLDRDGVINTRIVGGYVSDPNEFELIADIVPLLHHARSKGYLLVQVSNQQGVGKGLMTHAQLLAVTEHMQGLLAPFLGGRGLDDLRVCTDLDGANSPRRKPRPGMLLEAMEELGIDASRSWFLGDSMTDAQAGRAAGVHTALIGPFEADAADLVMASHAELQALIDVLR
jgi:D-glycero-D-manno-heptose 1,7-bisphosphate phosphatase